MSVTTFTTRPGPYSEHVQTCRSREGSAAAARSRCVSLADDLNASAGLLALVLQLRLEHAPAGIEHGLRHPCLDQLGAAHIAYEDPLILIDDFPRKFMQGILAAARRRAVQALRLTLMAAALCLGDFLFEICGKNDLPRASPRRWSRRYSSDPRSSPTTSSLCGRRFGPQTGIHSHQSPTASWAKQPHFHFAPSSSSCSNTLSAFPAKRRHLVLRFNCWPLNGIHPRDRFAPRLFRHRNFVFLHWLRRVTNSAFTRWIVSEWIRSKQRAAPAVSLSRSKALSHFGDPEKGRAALSLVAFA